MPKVSKINQATKAALRKAVGSSWVDVTQHGAVGDGVTDDSAAFVSAIRAAVASGGAEVYVPNGTYRITQNGVFSDINETEQAGLHFRGAGWRRSAILVDPPAASDVWLYDNSADRRFQFLTFTDLLFTSSTPTYGKCFKLTSSGLEQGFQFTRCYFRDVGTVLQLEGTANASEMRFSQCKMVRITGGVVIFSNSQAVNIELYGTDIECTNGSDFFIVDGDGGGSVKVFGGSFIIDNQVGDDAEYAVLNTAAAGSTLGPNNFDFSFYSVKTELRGDYSTLVKAPNVDGGLQALFVGCNLNTASSTARDLVSIHQNKHVTFEDCVMPESMTYLIAAGTPNVNANPGRINFDRCRVPDSLSELVTISDTWGSVSAKDCYRISRTSSVNRQALDFDMGFLDPGYLSFPSQAKAVSMKAGVSDFPYNATGDRTITLPKDALISRVRVHKPASGASASTYQLFVGSDDKATVYGISTQAAQSAAHSIDVHLAPMIDAGTGNRVVRIWATGGDEAQSGGYAIVEYF